ncbi:PUA domain-containing protein [Halomontanus rarus]|uniref:PUA domain-containing protein n=1 Tax=Halomontanus rarus TaxID=3034020 RepID=UPI003CE5A594
MNGNEDGNGRERQTATGGADLSSLRIIADYQFGAGAGEALFPPAETLEVRRTSSGRPQQIHANADGRIASFGTDGRFTLGLEGGRRLDTVLESPAYRVIVDDESEPFVRDGKNVFAKFVSDVGRDVRPGDEVLVTHERGELLAVGRAELAADAIRDFETGMAVKVREGADESAESDEGQ